MLVLQKLKVQVQNGWPEERAEVDTEIRQYWDYREESSQNFVKMTYFSRWIGSSYSIKDEKRHACSQNCTKATFEMKTQKGLAGMYSLDQEWQEK